MINLYDLTNEELTELVARQGERPYRARQLLKWLYKTNVRSFDQMTDLPASFRGRLASDYTLTAVTPVTSLTSKDGTKKVLFELADGKRIEAVSMPYEQRHTLCISTQVGCSLGCVFCATGAGGFTRNLTAAEIIDQYRVLVQEVAEHANLVFMGMGEPLLNLDNVLNALKALLADWGFGLSKRKVTVSTSGYVPGMLQLAQSGLGVNLSVSLNASNDRLRSALMPINRRYPLQALMDACNRYPLPPGRRITYEYVLIDGVNDKEEHALELSKLLNRQRSKVNLIPLNPTQAYSGRPPSLPAILKFQELLFAANISAFIRESKGSEISGACGQLAGSAGTGDE